MPDAPPAVPWSPYDRAVPHTVGLADAADQLDRLRSLRAPTGGAGLAHVRDVVVVVSSSRGGSTLFAEILRRGEGLLHLRAEVNPLFVVAGLRGEGDTEVLAAELAAEIGNPADVVDAAVLADLELAVAWRLVAQWPELGVDVDEARSWVREEAPAPGLPVDDRELHLRILARARERHPRINPYYYDLPRDLVASRFPDAPHPAGPPGRQLIEMPPFVLVRPWRSAKTEELGERPLVLSTPRNAFRLGFLRALFPQARFRVVHLTRNPAASVNGLIDGWLHHGFFNVVTDEPLDIAGYSDRFDWGRRWWCYDFPPAWRDWTRRSLPEVCAEQWRSHHAAVLGFLDSGDVESLRVRFEDVVGSRRREVLEELGAWLGLGDAVAAAAGEQLPPVMATAPPRRRRWEPRADVLEPVLADPGLREMIAALDYEDRCGWD